MVEGLPKIRKIIELGSGKGQLTRMLKEKGYDITAVDVNKDELKKLEKDGIKAICRDLNDGADFGKADLYLGMAIIEHVYNLSQLLEDINKNTKNFICAIPNEFNMVAKVRYFMEKECQPFFRFNHCHRYHEREWEKIFRNHGFKIIKKSYVPLRGIYGLPFPLWNRGFSKEIKYVLKTTGK